VLLLLAACSAAGTGDPRAAGEDGPGGSEETGGPDETGGSHETGTPTDPFCDGQPQVTWANFGHGFLLGACQGCHAASAPDRHDAPESVTFDTVDEAWAWDARILSRSTGEAPTMPPLGGVSDDDRLLLEIWLRCATPGT
jgi:hypothetical protein